MKKILFASMLAFGATANAQQFGVKGGLNVSNISNLEDASSKVGFYGGLFMNMPIAKSFSIQPELLYNGKGAQYKDGSYKETVNLHYISIPLMFQYNLIPNLYLEAGPEFNFLIGAKSKDNNETIDIKDQVNTFDFGVGIGAGYYFIPSLGVTARYVAGISKVPKEFTGMNKARNGVFQVGLAYKFGK